MINVVNFQFDAVIKIGSMALIRKEDDDLDYNIFSRLAKDLHPGYILISSGATEIGRLDYMKRNHNIELKGNIEEIKIDYAAQGQAILMQEYRRFIQPEYSVRQLLVEHCHFNDPEKRDHISKFLYRAAGQNAIPIINYNDPVSSEEIRKMEISSLRKKEDEVVECVDNDETASVIAQLVNAKILLILSSVNGIYADVHDPSTIIHEISAPTFSKLQEKLDEALGYCNGSSRELSQGAQSKLQYTQGPLSKGTTVIIANAKHRIKDILDGKVESTKLFVK